VSKIERGFLCLYGHFSQPPRGSPLTNTIGQEPQAAPYQNWNERVNSACYKPNADADNYRHISFSFSEPLLIWLERRAPDVYQKIVESDRQTAEAHDGAGNALATAYHHNILPLARKRDKRTQILWGIAAFEHHYGRKPLGFWLPEMAVDSETLVTLAEAGIGYTVLAQQQIRDLPAGGGAGPYQIALPRGLSMNVFVRDDRLSSEISFNIHNLGGAGHWGRNVLMPARKNAGPLLLMATAGETFGHHYAGEEQFLYWLVNREVAAIGYQVTTLDEYFNEHPSKRKVEIDEPSSWSDQHGLANWATGQVTAQSDTTWRGALRRALDNAASELDRVYEDLIRPDDPWKLRDAYAPVLLGTTSAEDFIDEHAPKLDTEQAESLKYLLSAQELIQRSYNSYTFTANFLDSSQLRYAIACAAAALAIAQRATGRYMAERFVSDLAVVSSSGGQVTGTGILRSVVEELNLALELAE
jgi:alpha-amylase/alpha-mannosidase (GH57 family)